KPGVLFLFLLPVKSCTHIHILYFHNILQEGPLHFLALHLKIRLLKDMIQICLMHLK
ncbi:hypothetical protein ACJX0J_029529, partial [Zea mays]